MKKIPALLSALLIGVLTFAQPASVGITITGKITGISDSIPKTIRITQYRIQSPNVNDVDVSTDGSFTHKVFITEPNQITIAFAGYSLNFIANINQAEYRISAVKSANQPIKAVVLESPENEAYAIYEQATSTYLTQLNNYLQNTGKNSQISEQTNTYYKQLQKVANNYKGTFTASVLTNTFILSNQPRIYDSDYIKFHLLNTITFNNPSFYNTTYPVEILSLYTKFFLKDNATSAAAWYTQFISGVTDNDARSRLHELLFTTLYNGKLEKELSNYTDWVNANPQLINNLYVQHQSGLLAKILCGKKAPDVAEKNATGEWVTLQKTATNNKVTLLTIWSPTCEHCRHDIPLLNPIYEKYHQQGLEIFSVAVNSTEQEWKEFSEKSGIKWQNTYHPSGTPYGSLNDYQITTIPAFIAIDQNGVILKRFVKQEEIEDLMK